MSHYNSSTANSWQSRSNNSSASSGLFGQHDMVNAYTSAPQNTQNNSNNNNNSGSGNAANVVGYSNPAASLLAQFAVNGVNFGSLAANLPAALVNANVLAANLGTSNSGGSSNLGVGYQWHSSTQQTTVQQSSNNNSHVQSSTSRNSDQRIVSIGNGGGGGGSNNNGANNINSSSYKLSNVSERKSLGNTNNNMSNMSNNNNSINNSAGNLKSLMDIDTIRRNNANKMAQQNKSSPVSSSAMGSNKNGHHSNDMRRDVRDPKNDRDRDRRDNSHSRTSNSTVNNSNGAGVSSSSSSANTSSFNANKQNLSSNNLSNSLGSSNPLAQALLNQLAATSNTNNTALVAAALAAANVVSQQSHLGSKPASNNVTSLSSSNRRRSRSRSPSHMSSSSNTNNRNNHRNSIGHNNHNNNSTSYKPSSSSSHHQNHHNSNGSYNSGYNAVKKSTRSRSPSNSSQVALTKRLSSSNTSTFVPHHQTSSASSYNKSAKPAMPLVSSSSSSAAVSSSNRYSIKLPKFPLEASINNVSGLKARYAQLYIPSDFINVRNNWQNSLPLERSLKFNSRCLFHVMRKEAQPLVPNEAVLDPPDADHTWTVKVMLLAMPSINELYKRTTLFAEEASKSERLEHPSKVIQFLVGNKGKHELMALGGAWSASLDGPDPATNTQTLINTAIRTVKALTGIDLTACTQWFRFLDIQYNRNEDFKTIILPNKLNSESNEATGEESAQRAATEATLMLNDDKDVETTVMFLPNVWSLMPNSVEYQKLVEGYANYIDNPPAVMQAEATAEPAAAKKSVDALPKPQAVKQEEVPRIEAKEETSDENDAAQLKLLEEQSEVSIQALTNTIKAEAANGLTLDAGDSSDLIDYDENDDSESKLEPTHHSKLDLKKMKVDELRTELMARDLDTRGLKPQLINRLKEALDAEKDKEEAGGQPPQFESNTNEEKAEEMNNEGTASAEVSKTDDMQLCNNDNSDMIIVNDFDIESFQIDEKDNTKETSGESAAKAAVKTDEDATKERLQQEQATKAAKSARYERERLYKLPQSPHIIVHPNKVAKNGKFECQLVSLAHLLDYRKDDNKESAFEVALFSEHFNEMLIRDNGFTIYKHLLSIRTDKDKELFALANTALCHKRKLSTTSGAGEVKEDESAESKRVKPNEAEAGKVDEQPAIPNNPTPTKTIQLSKPKPKTVFKELLLAFTFFDTARTNYLSEKDLEDLLLLIGLSLSRSKAKALIEKLSVKDGLINYRTLTDKTPKEIAAEQEATVHFTMPSDEEIVANIITYDSYMRRLNPGQAPGASSSFNKATSVVEINGTSIDVLNTLKKLDESEHTANKLDQQLKEAIEEIDRLKTLNKTADRIKTRLSDELTDYKKKLRDQLRTNKEIDDRYIRFKDLLQRSRSQMNKLSDEIGDQLKRGQTAASSVKPNEPKKSVDGLKKEEPKTVKAAAVPPVENSKQKSETAASVTSSSQKEPEQDNEANKPNSEEMQEGDEEAFEGGEHDEFENPEGINRMDENEENFEIDQEGQENLDNSQNLN